MKNRTINDVKQMEPKIAYQEAIKKIKKINQTNLISLSTLTYKHKENKDSSLNGVIYSLKDNIATKDHITTGASKFLTNYKPPYNATVKNILDEAGAICVSKDNLDEFGLGGTGLFSGIQKVHHPLDETRISGGSSSGSSSMVSLGIVPFAIATDTGDSIRKPASFQNIVGFKPSYGAISRYGVYPYSPSLDHVGILSNNVHDVALVFSHLAKKDENDMTSIDLSNDYLKNLKSDKSKKLVVLNDALEYMHQQEKICFKKYLNQLEENGFNIAYEDFSLDLLKLIDPIYKTISYGEGTTCWANLNGILFSNQVDGKNFDEILVKSRTAFLGNELKRRFVIGAFCLNSENYEKIYNKSKKIRTCIINRANELLSKYDAIILPGASQIAPLITDQENNTNDPCNLCDDALQIANFGGYPSITIPAITCNNLFVGINIMTKQYHEQELFNIALAIEEVKYVC